MTSAKSTTVTRRTVNNKTGITTSTSTTKTGNQTTITHTTTIGKPKTTSSSSSVSSPASAPGMVLGEKWITGPNDTRDLCAPVALANALLAATGTEASSAAIERLYAASGSWGDSGVPVPVLLAEATASGLAGCCLASFAPALPDDADLAVMELDGIPGVHAAAVVAGRAVMWGSEVPLGETGAVILGAWSLAWHGEETSCRSLT
jgi:hypothetical protein